ncbi:MAG: hypothetical protein AAF411_15005 [Myxococcota bacterium]
MRAVSVILVAFSAGCATTPVQVSSNRLHSALVRLQEQPTVEVAGIELGRDSRVRSADGERFTLEELAAGCSANPARRLAGCRVQQSPWFVIGRRRMRGKTAKIVGSAAAVLGAVALCAWASTDGGPRPSDVVP